MESGLDKMIPGTKLPGPRSQLITRNHFAGDCGHGWGNWNGGVVPAERCYTIEVVSGSYL